MKENTLSKTQSFKLIIWFTVIFIILASAYISSQSQLLFAKPASGVKYTYYVDGDTGNDLNSGLQTQPWRTVQKAADSANIGDTVKVLHGNYIEEVNITRPGITFVADEHVTIKSFLISTDNTIVSGFYSKDSDSQAGGIVVSGSNNVVKNNVIDHACLAGIVLNGNNNLAEKNEIFRSRQCNGDADGIRLFGDGQIARDNYIHDISFAENPTAHIDCFQNFGIAPFTNAIIEGNRCETLDMEATGEGTTGVQTDDTNTVRNIIIRNNIFRVVHGTNLRGDSIYITNNVFVGDYHPKSYVFFGDVTNTVFQNNIIYNTATGILAGSGVTGGYNIIYNSNGIAPRRDSGYFSPTDKWQTMDPMFVNPKDGDYHLQTGSPAIGAGASGIDIGAYGLPAP